MIDKLAEVCDERDALRLEVSRLHDQLNQCGTRCHTHDRARQRLAARLDETQHLLAKCKIVALDTCIHEDELRRYIVGFVESYPESPRIAAESTVISACLKMQPGDDYIPKDPDDPSEVAEDCYIYTDDQYAIAKLVMALKKVIYGH